MSSADWSPARSLSDLVRPARLHLDLDLHMKDVLHTLLAFCYLVKTNIVCPHRLPDQ